MALTKAAREYRAMMDGLTWKGDPSTLRTFTGHFSYQMGWSTFAVHAPSLDAAETWAKSRHGWGSNGFVCGHDIKDHGELLTGVGTIAVLNPDGTLTGKVLS